MVYYNEIDKFCCAWLRNLISEGLIAKGDVDERDIRDVSPADLRGYTQCHFFAGIGVWSYALRLAGWPDDRPVFSGSCPCQPFSQAGATAGFTDERHLWPYWHHLICVCRPGVIFGEQVASKVALQWLDLVQDDLEGEGYAVGAADLCAAGCGAPHIRQRLWFVADCTLANANSSAGRQECTLDGGWLTGGDAKPRAGSGGGGDAIVLADTGSVGCDGWPAPSRSGKGDCPGSSDSGETRNLADASGDECGAWRSGQEDEGSQQPAGCSDALVMGDAGRSGLARWSRQSQDDGAEQPTLERAGSAVGGFWADAEWIYCRDGKWRPAKSGIQPLVAGLPRGVGFGGDPGSPINPNATTEARTMRLKGYGNSINAPLAAEFIRAYMETHNE